MPYGSTNEDIGMMEEPQPFQGRRAATLRQRCDHTATTVEVLGDLCRKHNQRGAVPKWKAAQARALQNARAVSMVFRFPAGYGMRALAPLLERDCFTAGGLRDLRSSCATQASPGERI
jgi:hypothetical protein